MVNTNNSSIDSKPKLKSVRLIIGWMILLFNLVLVLGGLYLIVLGGSWFYFIIGLFTGLAGWFFIRGNAKAIHFLIIGFVINLIWALFESGFNGWAQIPRLAGSFVILLLGLFIAPSVNPIKGNQIRKYGVLAWSGLVVIVLLGAYIHALPPKPGELPSAVNGISYNDKDFTATKGDWTAYGADGNAQRFSAVDQITPENVKKLKVAWTYHTKDIPTKYASELTPLKIGSNIYGCTPTNKLFSLDATTGKERWQYDPKVPEQAQPYTAACRGVAYYKMPNVPAEQECAERIVEGTLDMRLIAVDAHTGKACSGFGKQGQVDLMQGMGKVVPGVLSITSAPVIVQGVIVTGHQVLDNQWRYAPSGVIRGYDAVTGELRFAWDMLNPDITKLPPEGKTYAQGTPNSWAPISGDEKLGLAFITMGNSGADYYSSERSPVERQYSSSLVALDVHTGKPKWTQQFVKNDVWDYDVASQPSLIEFPAQSGSQTVPAILQATKQGDFYVINRATGEFLSATGQIKVPQTGIEPEQRAATQLVSKYHNIRQPHLQEKSMWGMSMIDQMICRIWWKKSDYFGEYTPAGLDKDGVQYPGNNGGADWGSVAIDPNRGVVVTNYNDMATPMRLLPRAETEKLGIYPHGDSRAHVSAEFSARESPGAQIGTPYGILKNAGWQMPKTSMLCKEPPYGHIRAFNLKTGETLWDHPYGSARENGPFGIATKLPFNIGTPNNGGSAVTASGLVFISAATDNRLNAIDLKTGKILWSDKLPAGGQATPIVYEQNGKAYVLIMAGGHHFMRTPAGDSLIAYSLSD